MNRWNGKVAIVTGASSGIGESIAEALVKHGIAVVGLARRVDRLKDLATRLGKDKFYPIQCDLRKEEDILKALKWVEKELGGADILVNNAGVAIATPVIDSPTEEYYKVIETNLIAPTICAREVIQSLKKRNTAGHVINVNSIAGHFAESLHIPFGMYCASKYGLTALCSELRHEIIAANLNIKVTNISPGVVETEMIRGLFPSKSGILALKAEDVTAAIIYAVGTPEHVEIPEIIMMPHGTTIGPPIGVPTVTDLKKKK